MTQDLTIDRLHRVARRLRTVVTWPRLAFLAAVCLALAAGNWLADAQRQLTRNEVATDLLANGRASLAAHVFEDPLRKGVAFYRAQQYQHAAQAWQALDGLPALYNRASALAHYGRYREAIKALQAVLSQQPNHPDALHNLEVIQMAARLARQQRDPTRTGAAADHANDDADSPMESLARLDSNEDIQTVSNEPGEENQGPQPAAPNSTSAGPARPGDAGDEGSDSAAPKVQRDGTVFAAGATGGEHGEREDFVIKGGQRRTRAGEQQSNAEQNMDAEIALRFIQDDPAAVLRARLVSAWNKRNGTSR